MEPGRVSKEAFQNNNLIIASNEGRRQLASLDSRPLRKAAWYTLFTHAPELSRILVIVNCSIFISILIPHLVVKH